jgi:small subunit ribosomal protein S16
MDSLSWNFAAVEFRKIEEEFRVLTIRLARIGKKKHPFYRVVVTEKTRPRNGRFVEIVGTYDPQKKPAAVQLDNDRVQYWLSKGAQPSDTVRSLIRNPKPA